MFAVPRFARLIAAAAITAIAGAASVAKEVFANSVREPAGPPRTRGSANRRTKHGFGNAHVRRCSRKRKNQARHKAHCRRQRGIAALEAVLWVLAAGAIVSIAIGMDLRDWQPSAYREPAHGRVRCVDGVWSEVTNSGAARPVADRNGRAIACPLT